MIHINDFIQIHVEKINYRAIRSSGPGGQHVNKVSTGIHLKNNLNQHSYPNWFIIKIKEIAGKKLSESGEITIKANSHRSQLRKKEDALKRLVRMFKKAVIRPKSRIKIRPSRKINNDRIASKKRNSEKKQLRKRPELND